MNERATTVEGVRRTNLAEVLRLVHHSGPRSRAVITAETGLNRSTVSDLVGRLVEAGLVEEHEPDPTRRVGRPSPVVAPSLDVVAIGVNPEIDAVEIGAVSLGGAVRERIRSRSSVPASRTSSGSSPAWCRTGRTARSAEAASRASASRCPVSCARRTDWCGSHRTSTGATPTSQDPSPRRWACPSWWATTPRSARAERLFGAAREHEDVVYLNGGASGIGGGLILHGMLIGGVGGYAGEWGQTAASVADPADRRAEGGVLEDEVNRARLVQVAGLAAPEDAELRTALTATSVDAVAAEVARQRRILTATLGNAVNVLNPAMIVLGGFLGILRELDPAAFDDEVRRRALAASAEQLEISAAALGADRLLIGAADAAFERLLADPLG